MRDIVSSCNSGGWLVDSNGPSARMHEVHLEGSCGVLRNTGIVAPPTGPAGLHRPPSADHTAQVRESSLLVNVSAINSPNGRNVSAATPSVFFDAPGTLILQGGSFGGGIELGDNASAWSLGVHLAPGAAFAQRQGTKGATVYEMSGRPAAVVDHAPEREQLAEEQPLRHLDGGLQSRVSELEAQNARLWQEMRELRALVAKQDDDDAPDGAAADDGPA